MSNHPRPSEAELLDQKAKDRKVFIIAGIIIPLATSIATRLLIAWIWG